LKSRKDKDANHSSVASKVWETITGYDLRENLQETLNQMKASYFDKNKKPPRSPRDELDEEEYYD
jgi:hypothetical protein